MSRKPIEAVITDFSQFTKNISRAWPDEKPSHLSLMNLLAGAAGYKNIQHLKAIVSDLPETNASSEERRWQRLLDRNKKVCRWPTKRKDQLAILWLLVSRLPTAPKWNQRQFDGWIKSQICFGDHVLVRREIVELKAMNRTKNGSLYWRDPINLPEKYSSFIAAN